MRKEVKGPGSPGVEEKSVSISTARWTTGHSAGSGGGGGVKGTTPLLHIGGVNPMSKWKKSRDVYHAKKMVK